MKTIILLSFTFLLSIGIYGQDRIIRTSDSVDLFVRVKGTGTPCLYIHGGPGSGSHWLEKFSGGFLEKHFMMIYLDQRGCSRSTSPVDGNYSMERMVKDFEEVRQALGIDKWLTMGHSFGDIYQVDYALRHPEALLGMMMINCTLNLNGSREEVIPKACEFAGITDIRYYTDTTVARQERMARIGQLYGQLREKDQFWKMGYASYDKYQEMNASFEDIPNWNKDLENVPISMEEFGINFKKYTSQLKMPVLFFYGKSDYMVGPTQYKGVNFPDMLLWGSNVGHVPFLENREDFEAAVLAYQGKYHF